MKDKIFFGLKIAFFLFCMFLLFYGQQTVGKWELFLQLVGLAGLLFLLWNYNRKFI
ncbi:MAG: D-alanyl-lipoteichoic acid biosynthesis protein DltB [Virgibacillus proomii]